jgi:hypothetical protein
MFVMVLKKSGVSQVFEMFVSSVLSVFLLYVVGVASGYFKN